MRLFCGLYRRRKGIIYVARLYQHYMYTLWLVTEKACVRACVLT